MAMHFFFLFNFPLPDASLYLRDWRFERHLSAASVTLLRVGAACEKTGMQISFAVLTPVMTFPCATRSILNVASTLGNY